MLVDQGKERVGSQSTHAPGADDFRRAVLRGLALPQKRLPSTYFYDAEGARLFTRICLLPEYYLTRIETEILRDNATSVAGLVPEAAVIVEFGSGASEKIGILLDHLERPAAYVPIDVSPSCLREAARRLRGTYPALTIKPVHADFTRPLVLGEHLPVGPRLGFFPGSTIGNFDPEEAIALLRRIAAALGQGCQLIIGVDLKKDVTLLHAAYNDPAGITAAFNLNVLSRANRELGADFRPSQFVHRAPYNRAAGRIEMHLVSQQAQTVHVDGKGFSFCRGETIHTENSYKYSIDDFVGLAAAAGFAVRQTWTDRQRLFSVHLLVA